MTKLLNRITINPEQCGGRPCIRGMRIRVRRLNETARSTQLLGFC
jgi:uncharacterized protein (DUF433 family)